MQYIIANIQPDVHYLMSRRLSSPLHIIISRAWPWPITLRSYVLRRVNIVTLPESLYLFSRGDFEKELVVSM